MISQALLPRHKNIECPIIVNFCKAEICNIDLASISRNLGNSLPCTDKIDLDLAYTVIEDLPTVRMGLLLACCVLKMLEMDDEYQGNGEEYYSGELAESRRPFRAFFDVGLIKTTTSNCVFGALDGRIDIPHSEKRFAGFNKDGKQVDAKVHRKYIDGGHAASDHPHMDFFIFVLSV
ncbi:hypothetical protein R6Q59_012155 [Mikania micrantha]